jgi:Spy/CpxP family protein refolding chaperone
MNRPLILWSTGALALALAVGVARPLFTLAAAGEAQAAPAAPAMPARRLNAGTTQLLTWLRGTLTPLGLTEPQRVRTEATLAELERDLGKVAAKGGSPEAQKAGYRAAFQQYQASLTHILTPEQLAKLRALRDPHPSDGEDGHDHTH